MRSWQLVAVVAFTGLASGAAGAMAYSRFAMPGAAKSVPAAEAQPATSPPRPVVVPPGWDATFVPRLAVVEHRLDTLSASSSATATAPNKESGLIGDDRTREEKRADHYQQELDYRTSALADHAREPADSTWSAPQVASMQDSLGRAFDGTARTKSVDCRSKTCTATLSFATPSDALVALQRDSRKLSVQGCKGAVAIPTPPASPGPYDLTVLYNCR